MPIRRDRLEYTYRSRGRARGRSFGFSLLVLLAVAAFFALMRLVSRPFMDDEPQADDGRPRGVSVARLNPWRVKDATTRSYVNGDGTRLDPQTPDSSDDLFAAGDAPFSSAEESRAEMGNVGETTKQGADFAGLELPADERDDYFALNWKENDPNKDWGKQTNLAPFRNYKTLDFQPINSIANDGFLGYTLMNGGKPTYEPSKVLDQRQFDNAAEASQSNQTSQASQESLTSLPKVALNTVDSTERPAMTPAERIQPGVVFIPSGYRRGGVAQASGSGAMGRVSTIVR